MSNLISTGDVEQIRLVLKNSLGNDLLGATGLLVRIQRASDGFYLDHDDATFKSSGWTTRDEAAVEVDQALLPGIYELSGGFDSGGIANLVPDDTYIVFAVKGPAPDTADGVMPQPGEFKVGWALDAIETTAVVSATIAAAVPSTLELMAWLVRGAAPVTSGLISATVSVEDAAGAVVVASGAMTGPTSAGVFRRSVATVSLADATNYVARVVVTDSVGAQESYTAIPTLG